ncbi:MAG TPA: hypothetical protein VIK18_23625, partial [Pirellulales bacterium]
VRWQVAPSSPRLWAKSADGNHTVQLQQDALFANWEYGPNQRGLYLNYADRRADFGEKLHSLDRFLSRRGFGRVQPTSCFVTYVNHVESDAAASSSSSLQRVLTFWKSETSDDWLPPLESLTAKLSFAMPDKLGRLHVDIAPGVRHADKKHIIRLDLMARGTPGEGTIDSALAWLDMGHEWIVRGFTSVTHREMHGLWERES